MPSDNAIQVYTDEDVLSAARRRISYLFDEFENIIVSISGGKDSTVTAHLALTEAHKRGRRIGIFFLDEEVVYASTIEQVRYLMTLYPENTIKLWLQIEFNLTNSTSFEESQLKCWEAGKHKMWMRPKERDSIQHKSWDPATETVRDKNKGFGFYDVLENFQNSQKNTAFLVGIRATESPNRWRACARNKCYKDVRWGTKRPNGNYTFYPIYDWNFSDVWKYLYENGVRYSRIYDYQHKMGFGINDIRVSSLVHEKSFKSLVELPRFEPKTYDRLCKRMKGIRFGNEFGRNRTVMKCQKLPENFKSWMEYRDFLLKTYPDREKKPIFEKRFAKHLNNNYVARQQCRQLILNDYENNLPVSNREDPILKRIEFWRDNL